MPGTSWFRPPKRRLVRSPSVFLIDIVSFGTKAQRWHNWDSHYVFVRMKASRIQTLSENRACMINCIKFCLVDPIDKKHPLRTGSG